MHRTSHLAGPVHEALVVGDVGLARNAKPAKCWSMFAARGNSEKGWFATAMGAWCSHMVLARTFDLCWRGCGRVPRLRM